MTNRTNVPQWDMIENSKRTPMSFSVIVEKLPHLFNGSAICVDSKLQSSDRCACASHNGTERKNK